ncbi:hypothetical protein Pyrfu_1134 [Pyrolobus fumarii 1A]|uniref:Uncharacterized protein n=1 Tax=Pyrolobus fumarii (strain DSM 11204 / 1A) TaxID=694429 RepID=G0EFH6_PYRF1|nr:hypothetical protein [Pyrolobus fumarii]AEM39000.1 hypothetical protein Pyrfu_1134 [Pyrolobus fumarii 1A]
MSYVSVKIDAAAKRVLEELQARLLLETGVKFNLQDILAAAVRLAARRRGELIAELMGGWRPLRGEEAEELLREYSFEGPEDASEEVDRVLYS